MAKSMTVEQVQYYCLEMLSFFDNYAKENNIVYYLAGGTLLGAIRHKGFIPWDDDVDLMIPREDYDKLIKTFSNKRYHIACCEFDSKYKTPFARLWDTNTRLKWELTSEEELGVFIDLFPIDGFPANDILTRIHLFHIKYIRELLNLSEKTKFYKGERYKLLKKIIKSLIRRDGNYYSKHLNDVAKRYKYCGCKFVGVKTTSGHLFKEKNNKNIFYKTLRVPFENLILPIPAGYDLYLRHLYGNYMQLPPEVNRKSVHYFTITTKNNNN